jgi:hypothetical protein
VKIVVKVWKRFEGPAREAFTLLYEYRSGPFAKNPQIKKSHTRRHGQQTGRCNRMDPFAGNYQDPQSLHKSSVEFKVINFLKTS